MSARATQQRSLGTQPKLPIMSAKEPLPLFKIDDETPRGALAADPPLIPTDDFLKELESESQKLESATPQQILQYAVDRFAPNFTMATAFGPEGMTIIHMLSTIAPETPIFNLDTGYQFKETLDLRERVKGKYGIEVEYKLPDTTVEQYEAMHGGPLYKTIQISAALIASYECCMKQQKASMLGPARFVAIRALTEPRHQSWVGTASFNWSKSARWRIGQKKRFGH